MKTFPQLLLFLLLTALGAISLSASAAADDLAARVVIVVNERDPDSIRVGEHYAEKRGIPRDNIIAIRAPTRETITRSEFIDDIRNPLQRQLLERGWLRGMYSRLRDNEGRYRSIIEGHNISYLVLCRGVPLRIRHDPERMTPEMERMGQKEFRTNQASVDSELALLTGLAPLLSFVPNPLFEKRSPTALELNSVLKVARLDGATAADAMALVDNAIAGEELGLRGRAYVDLEGPHPAGTAWLRSTADQLRSLGYDLSMNESKGVFSISSRFDAPALYFGWYAQDVTGPFLLDDFRFPPGAIAFHIHSFSARTVRNAETGWVAPFVARGAAVTLGNVYEPYLELSHRPDLFLEWLKRGGNVGDAAAFSIRAFSWQNVVIGDPLYRPFSRSLDEQLAADGAEPDALDAYALIRQMNLLAAQGRRKEAVEKGLLRLKERPNLALAVAVANMQIQERDRRRAVQTLAGIEKIKPASSMEVALAKEAADLLSTLNEHQRALEIYESLLGSGTSFPVEIRKTLLEDGVLLASRLGRRNLTQAWRAQLTEL